jgi:hypothetical protein
LDRLESVNSGKVPDSIYLLTRKYAPKSPNYRSAGLLPLPPQLDPVIQ